MRPVSMGVCFAAVAFYLVMVGSGMMLRASPPAGWTEGEERAALPLLRAFRTGQIPISEEAVREMRPVDEKRAVALADKSDADVARWLRSAGERFRDISKAKDVYNLYQIAYNSIMVWFLAKGAWDACEGDLSRIWTFPLDTSPRSLGLAFGLYIHYTNKFVEFIDTVFMMMAGNWRQVSPLHVIHHAIMGPVWAFGINASPGGQPYFSALLNSFIHVLMYTYYYVSSRVKLPTSIKMGMTVAQLVQFVLALSHGIYHTVLHLNGSPNAMHPFPVGIELFTSTLMIVMFSQFFFKTYCGKPTGDKSKSKPKPKSKSKSA